MNDELFAFAFIAIVAIMASNTFTIMKALSHYVEPDVFLRLLAKEPGAIVFYYEGPVFRMFSTARYVATVKGTKIYTQSPVPLVLPEDCEKIRSRPSGVLKWIHGDAA